MKNKTIYILSFVVLLFSGCDLDLNSPSEIVENNFWKTEKDAWYALNACYSQLPDYLDGMLDEMTTDNAHSHKPWEGPMEDIQRGNMTSANDWGGYNYALIRKANVFLENVDNCAMDEDLKERMKGEARFFRALRYFEMITKFGGVPLTLEVLPYDAPYMKRNDVEEVRAFVLKELEEIADILPQKYAGGMMQETGRITSGAALSLRARAALYFSDFKEAEKSAKKVIESGVYKLFSISSLSAEQQKEVDELAKLIDFESVGIDKETFGLGMFSYESLWQGDNASPRNPEYILTREHMNDPNYVDWAKYQYSRPSQLVRGYSSYEPMQDLVDAYWKIDGKTIPETIDPNVRAKNFATISKEVEGLDQQGYIAKVPTMDLGSYEYMNEFKNRDSRLYASMLIPFLGWHVTDFGSPFYYRMDPKNIGEDGNESWTGFSWRKMISTHGYDTGGQNSSYDDFPLIRYAEVLLTAAEAHIHNSGYDNEVQKYLNQIRQRCGMPNVPTSFPSKEAALDFLRQERRIELAGEGQRYMDIRRYGQEYCKKVMSGPTYAPNKRVVVEKGWKEHLMLMPIPQSAIDMNPLLKEDQNPGYN